ncbi:hypothetical protein AMELA_G00254850 [Ameiurus melas]|uniref:Uncharacterized protein n=1 Tax=Ameiurus melas TaxID=219545 RepID=A0A7J5ZTN4_AMEME|nr:hypothetical protein AMELA_G00254850 [Ameiurus melas]
MAALRIIIKYAPPNMANALTALSSEPSEAAPSTVSLSVGIRGLSQLSAHIFGLPARISTASHRRLAVSDVPYLLAAVSPRSFSTNRSVSSPEEENKSTAPTLMNQTFQPMLKMGPK